MTIQNLQQKKLALCIDAGEYEGVSLFTMKIYEYLPDPASEKDGFLRVIDEDGEPYYYDAKAFLKISAHRSGLKIPLPSSSKQYSNVQIYSLGSECGVGFVGGRPYHQRHLAQVYI